MSQLRALSAVLLITVLSFVGNRSSAGALSNGGPDLNSLSDDDLKTMTIVLGRTQCFGNCPAYTVKIHGNGVVEYAGWEHVKVKGGRDGKIEQQAIRALVAELAAARFLSLPDIYSQQGCKCRRCTDMASVVIELVVRGTKYRVDHYQGCACAPKALWDIELAIDKAAQAEQWTGDVSKQGPYGTTCFGS